MCGKSQSNTAESFQLLNDTENAARKRINTINTIRCAQIAAKYDLVKHYTHGDLSLIFDFPANRNIDAIRERFCRCPCESIRNGFAGISLHVYAYDPGVFDERDQQLMFVRVVDCVNGPDGKIPSLVRPYVIYDKVKESGGDRVYFSPMQRSFKLINGISNRELGGIVNDRRGYAIEGLDPSIIESAPQVVDG